MPYAEQYFSGLGHAKPFNAGALSAEDLAHCNALLVRSTTKVDASLLATAPHLQYVATATAGYNHLSMNALQAANLTWYAAGGCNARAVAEYILAALYALAERRHFMLVEKVVAVVGVGNVGRTLVMLLKSIGAKVIEYDPPRGQIDKEFVSANFDEVLAADIITLHTPLVTQGEHPTYHMFNASVIAKLAPHQILINACRGEVIDNRALLNTMVSKQHKMPAVVLDCWEREPHIDTALIGHLAFATAHIAGHSLEGKAKGTDMVYQDLCRFLGEPQKCSLTDLLPPCELDTKHMQNINNLPVGTAEQTIVSETIKSMYDIENDDRFFRHYMAKSASFSDIRRNYRVRREWPAANISISNNKAAATLKKLGFTMANDSN
jgi:erythronate-4-phosphate dehydrogenase